MSISNYGEEQILNSIYNAGSVSVAARFVKLHIGDPGEDCTANPAAETTRKALTNAAAANPGGTFTSVNDLIWTNVAATEAYTYVSIWDNATVGNPWWYGPLTANPVTAGDTFTIPTGSLVVTLA